MAKRANSIAKDLRTPKYKMQVVVSKKAFKQAIGSLYRDRKIEFLNPGIQLTTAPKSGPR